MTTLHNKDYSVLNFYGIGGIGKSALLEHLKLEHLKKRPSTIYGSVNFKIEANRSQHVALRRLTKSITANFNNISFPIFEIAYLIYWSKAYPDYDIKKDGLPFLEEGSLISSAIGLFDSFGSIIGVALNIVDFVIKNVNLTLDQKDGLRELTKLSEIEIEKRLPMFFAEDIKYQKESEKIRDIIFFFDTYEALWEHNRNEANKYSEDAWIRELVASLPNTLFVLSGREKVRWVEISNDWNLGLNQYRLEDFSSADAMSFLTNCNITDLLIQEKIIGSSEGVPFYLNLSVDTYYQILNSDKIPTVKDFSNIAQHQIFELFMKYLDRNELETLKVLANARFYTKETFEGLVDYFKTAFPVTAMNQLNAFSFINEENGTYFIHDLMRKSLVESQNDILKNSVYTFLFEHYDNQLNNIQSKDINDKHISAFQEAFHYNEYLNDIESLCKWYNARMRVFIDAAKYKPLLKVQEYLYSMQLSELGNEHSDTLVSMNNLATIYTTPNSQDNYFKNLIL